MPGLADKPQNDGDDGHCNNEHHRQQRETLAALDADDEIKQQPDQDADNVGYAAEVAQFFEVMLSKLSLQCRRGCLFGNFIFEGFEHGVP